MGNDTLEQQTNGLYNDSEIVVRNTTQNQVIGNNIDDKIRKVIDNAVMTVEKRMEGAILRAMDKLAIPRNEMALRSIAGSSGHASNNVVQNPDRKDFRGNTEKKTLMLASSRFDLYIDQDGTIETGDVGNFEDGDFPAPKHNYDRGAQGHYMVTGHNTSQHIIPEILAGRCQQPEDVLIIFRLKYIGPQSQATSKHKWHEFTFATNTESLSDLLEELNKCDLLKQLVDSLL